VHAALGELIVVVIDTKVTVAQIDQTVVTAPAIGVDDRGDIDPAADNALQSGSGAVRHDLGVDLARPLEDAEHDGLAVGTSAALAADVARAEPALVHFDNAEEGALRLAGNLDTFAQATVQSVHGIAVQPAELGSLQGQKIGCKAAYYGPDLALRNACTLGVPIFH
jgi:hypothetical protein